MHLHVGMDVGEVRTVLGSSAVAGVSNRSNDRYLEQLRAELGIAESQDAAWRAFAAAIRANAERLDVDPASDGGTGRLSPPSAPDALEQAFGALQQRLEALAAMRSATERLYAVLSPKQRQKADRLLPLCCLAGLTRGTRSH